MNDRQIDLLTTNDFLPAPEFRQASKRYRGDYKLKSFSCWTSFFAWLCPTESSRKLARYRTCLRANQTKLYHMGIRGRVSRNTLANANSSTGLAASIPTSPIC